MKIEFQKVYKFDLDNSRVVEVPIPDDGNDFSNYLEELMVDVLGDARSKKYLFPEEATETMDEIALILDLTKRDATAKKIAKRLMWVENAVQGRIEHLQKEVQKGIMIQAVVKMAKKRYFLIIKAEHFDYINETDRKRATGLPVKKKIFKAFSAHLDANDAPTHAMVSDYKQVISAYWWREFLKLEEEHTNDYNTERSFDALDRKIFNPLKQDYPRDYMYLRNATVQYFRSKAEFVMEDYLDDIVRHYEPEEESLNMEAIETKISALPEKMNFDSRFEIVREKIKKKIIKKLTLTPQLDLVIKENIDWSSTVQAVKEDGVKYIRIRTDRGFDHFNES